MSAEHFFSSNVGVMYATDWNLMTTVNFVPDLLVTCGLFYIYILIFGEADSVSVLLWNIQRAITDLYVLDHFCKVYHISNETEYLATTIQHSDL